MTPNTRPIRTVPRPDCHVCGVPGDVAYRDLRDRLFDVPGLWNLRQCPNHACGLLWLDPTPALADIGRLYERYYTHEDAPTRRPSRADRALAATSAAYRAHKYGYMDPTPRVSTLLRRLGRVLPGFAAQWDFSVFYLAAQLKGRLLEIGCGRGLMLKRMAELGWQAEGLDIDPKAVDAARRQGLIVHLGTIAAQGFPDDSFDAVVMSHVIEHVPDPRALVQECHRILKPGGRLVSITPNGGGWGHARYGPDWRGLEPPRHLHIFTAESMTGLARTAGFSDAKVSSVVANARGILLASRRLRRPGGTAVDGPYSRASRTLGRAMQIGEWLLLNFRPRAGEELLLQAVKGETFADPCRASALTRSVATDAEIEQAVQ